MSRSTLTAIILSACLLQPAWAVNADASARINRDDRVLVPAGTLMCRSEAAYRSLTESVESSDWVMSGACYRSGHPMPFMHLEIDNGVTVAVGLGGNPRIKRYIVSESVEQAAATGGGTVHSADRS